MPEPIDFSKWKKSTDKKGPDAQRPPESQEKPLQGGGPGVQSLRQMINDASEQTSFTQFETMLTELIALWEKDRRSFNKENIALRMAALPDSIEKLLGIIEGTSEFDWRKEPSKYHAIARAMIREVDKLAEEIIEVPVSTKAAIMIYKFIK